MNKIAVSGSLITLWILLHSNAEATDEFDTLHWGYLSFPPFVYEDKSGVTCGRLAEMFSAVTDKAGISFRGIQYPNRRVATLLNDGRINFNIIVKSMLTDQDKYVISRFPISKIELRAYWTGDKKPVYQFEDLAGSSVILLTAYSYGEGRKYIDTPLHNVIVAANVETHRRAFDALSYQRGEYFLGYKGPSEDALTRIKVKDLHFSTIGTLDLYFVLTKSTPYAKDIMAKLEQAWQEIYQAQD